MERDPQKNRSSILVLSDGDLGYGNLLPQCFGFLYRIISAGSISEALAVFGKEDVDLAVVDLNSSGLPGSDLLQVLKQKEETMGMVFIGEMGERAGFRRDFRFRTADFVSKPVVPFDFLSAVQKAMEKVLFRKKIISLGAEIRSLTFKGETEFLGESEAWARMLPFSSGSLF